ncbi:ABC transporter permease [bacterium]|nr:ABC transporter permease [bacterium]
MRAALVLPLQQLWTHWDLLRELTARELKVRYRRSALGFVWSLLTPIYQIIIYTMVLKYIMGWGGRNLSINILVALIPWTYFNVTVLNCCSSVLRYRGVVKKVYFPRQMLPLATVFANLVHLLLSTGVLFLFFLFRPVAFDEMFLFLIVLVIGETFLVSGLGFMAASAHTYFQDVEYALTNIFQVAMFLTPVLYSSELLNGHPPLYKHLFMLNPMAVYCEGWRGILLGLPGPDGNLHLTLPDPMYLGIALGVSVLAFLLGLMVWQRHEWRLPEVL